VVGVWVAAGLASSALFGLASAAVVVLGTRGVLLSAGLSVAVALGYALIALWLCLALRRLGFMEDGDDGADGHGRGGNAGNPTPPRSPSDGPDLWPEFERELRAYLEAHERVPVG
jgi:hypothetical protein